MGLQNAVLGGMGTLLWGRYQADPSRDPQGRPVCQCSEPVDSLAVTINHVLSASVLGFELSPCLHFLC